MVVLVAVVTGGVHSAPKYCWDLDNVPDEAVYPILNASSVGEYTCLNAMSTLGISLKATFTVTSGKLLEYYSHCSLKYTLLHVFIGSGDNWEVKVHVTLKYAALEEKMLSIPAPLILLYKQ